MGIHCWKWRPPVWLVVFPGVWGPSVWQTIITGIWGFPVWLSISPRVRERMPVETVRALKCAYLKATRVYSKALKRSRKAGNECMVIKLKRECTASFWKFASKILDNKASSDVEPTFSVDTAEQFFTNTYSSSPYTFSLPSWLPTPAEPKECFDCDPIGLDEVISVIKRSRASSSPSPFDAISYQIFKRYTALMNVLVHLCNRCWACRVHGSKHPSNLSQSQVQQRTHQIWPTFTQLPLHCALGKFILPSSRINGWSLWKLASTLTRFRKRLCHLFRLHWAYTKLATAVNEARTCHKSLCVCWLDLANSYGSVHHDLIKFSLKYYMLPTN